MRLLSPQSDEYTVKKLVQVSASANKGISGNAEMTEDQQ